VISIISPFYNEEIILDKAIDEMLKNLKGLDQPWELILVNDGSTDSSLEIAVGKADINSNVKVVTYSVNRGRGNALRQGINSARGDIIITTEIDCSWGNNIVNELVKFFETNKSADIVIASTNLPGGGYENVPKFRALLSQFGNLFLRFMISKNITLYTGMTRGYRAKIIKNLPTSEAGKEFHLEVLAKAISFNYNIKEIPAKLTWQDQKLSNDRSLKRKSSSKVRKIASSHLLFGLSGRPYRYLFFLGLMMLLVATTFLIWGLINLINGEISIYLLSLSLSGYILSVLFGGIGVLSLQQNTILREIWRVREELKSSLNKKD
jgi:glycosyltransferase involved in cell wall biosynthesis